MAAGVTLKLLHVDLSTRETRVEELPETIAGILKCPNPNCISNHERIETRFKVETQKPLHVRCHYCERRIRESEFVLF